MLARQTASPTVNVQFRRSSPCAFPLPFDGVDASSRSRQAGGRGDARARRRAPAGDRVCPALLAVRHRRRIAARGIRGCAARLDRGLRPVGTLRRMEPDTGAGHRRESAARRPASGRRHGVGRAPRRDRIRVRRSTGHALCRARNETRLELARLVCASADVLVRVPDRILQLLVLHHRLLAHCRLRSPIAGSRRPTGERRRWARSSSSPSSAISSVMPQPFSSLHLVLGMRAILRPERRATLVRHGVVALLPSVVLALIYVVTSNSAEPTGFTAPWRKVAGALTLEWGIVDVRLSRGRVLPCRRRRARLSRSRGRCQEAAVARAEPGSARGRRLHHPRAAGGSGQPRHGRKRRRLHHPATRPLPGVQCSPSG